MSRRCPRRHRHSTVYVVHLGTKYERRWYWCQDCGAIRTQDDTRWTYPTRIEELEDDLSMIATGADALWKGLDEAGGDIGVRVAAKRSACKLLHWLRQRGLGGTT